VGIARQIGQYCLGAGERTLGIHHPFASPQRCQELAERFGIVQTRMLAEELELVPAMQLLQFLEEAPPEQPRQHTHRQEEAAPASHPAFTIQ